jgi:hypothetical protein
MVVGIAALVLLAVLVLGLRRRRREQERKILELKQQRNKSVATYSSSPEHMPHREEYTYEDDEQELPEQFATLEVLSDLQSMEYGSPAPEDEDDCEQPTFEQPTYVSSRSSESLSQITHERSYAASDTVKL